MSDTDDKKKINKYINKINIEQVNKMFDEETIKKISNMVKDLSYFRNFLRKRFVKYEVNMNCEGYLRLTVGDTDYYYEKYLDGIIEKDNMMNIYLMDSINEELINYPNKQLNLTNLNYETLLKTNIILAFIYLKPYVSQKLRLLGIDKLSQFRKSFIDLVHLKVQELDKIEAIDEKDKSEDDEKEDEIIEGNDVCIN